jgi:branched-chain amino acid transport system substrate-binding protein
MKSLDDKGQSRRDVLKRVLGAGVVAATQGISNVARAAAPVRIGYSIARTGYLGVASPVANQAYELWRDQINAQGGLEIAGEGRRPVEFVVYDDQSEPVKATEAYEKLITRDKVDLVLAPYGTPFHIAVAPVVERYKMPLVGDTASTTLLRDLGARYMWFSQPLADAYAKTISDFLHDQGVTSTSLMTLQLPVSLETKKYMLPLLKQQNIATATDVEYSLSVSDMTSMVASIKSAAPQAMIGLSYPGDSILYVNAAREAGLQVPIQLLFVAPSSPFFLQKFGAAAEGILTIGEWSPNQTRWNGAKAFFDDYSRRWKEPPDYLDSSICYVSCQILQQAVAKVGLDREKIRETISATTFDTIKGPVHFKGGVNDSTIPGLMQIQNGTLEIIWPKEIATASFKPKKGWG